MQPVARYLHRLHQIHASGQGTAETSSYSPLEELLETIGKGLKPVVVPIAQLRNQGAGMPDFGLFTKDQLKKGADKVLSLAVNPARGVVEVKGAADNTWLTAKGAQATKYWEKYRLVLVTNYRDFLILGQSADGKPLPVGTYSIATDEAAFWGGILDEVWQYSLGGYQVLKKWLSYRESKLLGRALSIDEADHFTTMARRIAALLALGAELDANYAVFRGPSK